MDTSAADRLHADLSIAPLVGTPGAVSREATGNHAAITFYCKRLVSQSSTQCVPVDLPQDQRPVVDLANKQIEESLRPLPSRSATDLLRLLSWQLAKRFRTTLGVVVIPIMRHGLVSSIHAARWDGRGSQEYSAVGRGWRRSVRMSCESLPSYRLKSIRCANNSPSPGGGYPTTTTVALSLASLHPFHPRFTLRRNSATVPYSRPDPHTGTMAARDFYSSLAIVVFRLRAPRRLPSQNCGW